MFYLLIEDSKDLIVFLTLALGVRPQMSDPQFDYALDPTGSLAANKIVQESHTITAINDRNYNFIIPIEE